MSRMMKIVVLSIMICKGPGTRFHSIATLRHADDSHFQAEGMLLPEGASFKDSSVSLFTSIRAHSKKRRGNRGL